MGQGCLPNLTAGVPALDHAQQVTNFIKGKAQLSATPDEDKPFQVGNGINPMPAPSAGWPWQKPDLLVVANGFDVNASVLRQFTNAKLVIGGQKSIPSTCSDYRL